MDLFSQRHRHYTWLALMLVALFSYVFFSPNLDNYSVFVHINQAVSKFSLFYFDYIGTNRVYAYFFIALLVYVICQWHLSHYAAYKPLFIALSLAISVTIIQCAGVFFTNYIEHLNISTAAGTVQLVHNSVTSLPGGHIARLVALATCICWLTQKRWIQAAIIIVVSLILVGVGVTFYDRMFISTGLIGVLIGYWVPYYLKMLLFTHRPVQQHKTQHHSHSMLGT